MSVDVVQEGAQEVYKPQSGFAGGCAGAAHRAEPACMGPSMVMQTCRAFKRVLLGSPGRTSTRHV
jgi:hypothetical protein